MLFFKTKCISLGSYNGIVSFPRSFSLCLKITIWNDCLILFRNCNTFSQVTRTILQRLSNTVFSIILGSRIGTLSWPYNYGNTGCWVFKQGLQKEIIEFWELVASCQKLGFILVSKLFKNWCYQKIPIIKDELLNWYSF